MEMSTDTGRYIDVI